MGIGRVFAEKREVCDIRGWMREEGGRGGGSGGKKEKGMRVEQE
jgi:hypothetical protein